MNDIQVFNNNDQMLVSAREIHKVLGIEKRFSVWFETNSQGFVEGEDFTSVLSGTVVNNGANRELQDYQCSIDMAKHICLMSRTEKGKECRQYLIDLEKAWNTPEQILARALKVADQTIASLNNKIDEMKPKAIFADAVKTSKKSVKVRDLAVILKQNGIDIGEKRLYKWFRENGYICKYENSPTQKAMNLGLFEVETIKVDRYGYEPLIRQTTKVTGKGQIYFVNKFLSERR